MDYPIHFDCIVVGGGHAGAEAASACARMGAKTLLITHNIETIGMMSCNPAIGGIGKGHLVKEIDAMGGIMGRAADLAGIQFRTLNARKGPAVQATRAQACRYLYRKVVREMLEHQENLSFYQQPVQDLIIKDGKVQGVTTQMGLHFYAKSVVLTVGTFLSGVIHIGQKHYNGGRSGDPASMSLSEALRSKALNVARLKTGTPPRIDGKSIDFSQMQEQPGDANVPCFSFVGKTSERPQQVSCYITHTNEKTHDIITQGLPRSAMYSGKIEGIGPRYCPSIEDKIVRFSDRSSHQIFVEPEGLYSNEYYPNGISTSLPFDVQVAFVHSMKGFENAHITRPGYAIEYDFFDPRDLKATLETKAIDGLFFAGQINGTTGYEEAGAQGLIAGINATLKVQGKPGWYPLRSQAYVGVLIDDLITHGTLEPYRMFTSRAEHRLLLREDNADIRLTPKANDLNLIDDHRWRTFNLKAKQIEQLKDSLDKTWISPGSESACTLQNLDISISKEVNLTSLLKRPELNFVKLKQALPSLLPERYDGVEELASELSWQIEHQVETQAKYEGYIEKQKQEIAKCIKLEHKKIPPRFCFESISGLSNEVVEKLNRHRPDSVAQASRIPGVTPAAISLLLIYLKKNQHESASISE